MRFLTTMLCFALAVEIVYEMSNLCNYVSSGEIVCEMEEEHLWESKQLGAHSPYVLLNTLIYFNTCYFHLPSVDDHLHLSFSHIMKHWKKLNIPGAKLPGRSVYLRYYVPAPIGKSWFWTQRVSTLLRPRTDW